MRYRLLPLALLLLGCAHLRYPDAPSTLEEAFEHLDHNLSPEDRETMRRGSEADMGQYHHGLGMGMRNGWGLWHDGPLAQWFHRRGIHHADDMSGIVLTSYWRRLNGQPLRLEEQLHGYQAYWASMEPAPKKRCDHDGRALKVNKWLYDRGPGGIGTQRHVGECGMGHFWIFQHGRGWSEASAGDLERIQGRIGLTERVGG